MMTTVMTIVAPNERGRIMGRISIVMSVAPAVGPAVSGVLLQVLPWQGLFWVMLPIAVAMLLVGMKWVPNVAETRKRAARRARRSSCRRSPSRRSSTG